MRAPTGAPPSSNYWAFPKGTSQFGIPGRRTMGEGRGKLTHNTLVELYFSGWQAYLRMPSF